MGNGGVKLGDILARAWLVITVILGMLVEASFLQDFLRPYFQ